MRREAKNMWPVTRLLAVPLGGVLVALGQRVLAGSPWAPWLTAAGALLVLGGALSLAWRVLRSGAPSPGESAPSPGAAIPPRARMWALLPHALIVLALGLALIPFGDGPGSSGDGLDWKSIIQWAWLLCLLAGAVLFVFVESALWPLRRSPAPGTLPEFHRVAWAGQAGLGMALLLLVVVVFNFAFNSLGWEWNLAYFRTTQPSEATREVALELPEPVEVGVFFTLDSSVAPLMKSYFDALTGNPQVAAKLLVEAMDADLRPEMAEKFKARANGWVILRKGDARAQIFVGDVFDKARDNLRTFDRNFFGKLLEMARPRRKVYLTVGHGERNEKSAGETREGAGLTEFQSMLRRRNLEPKPLGLEEGLGTAIPHDAALVVIAGAQEPFRPVELENLTRYLEAGGKLLVFLEPPRGTASPAPEVKGRNDRPRDLAALLARYGIVSKALPLANDRFFGRRTFTQADHELLVTVRYQAHPAVSALRRAPNQFPLLFLGAGALEKGPVRASAGGKGRALNVQEVIRGMPGTWADGNGNFTFDPPGESKGEPVLAMAASPGKPTPKPPPGGKAGPAGAGPTLFVYSDSDVASDLLLRNRANAVAMEMTVGWLSEDSPSGDGSKPPTYPVTEEDVRIVHAKGDDWLWFYLPVFGVPLGVLVFGLWRVSRARRKGESSDG